MATKRASRFFSTIVNTTVLAWTIACGKTEPGLRGQSNGQQLKVALLTPGPISDHSWNGGAYAGLLQIRDSLGAQISHVQTKTPAEFEENFRQYGAQGFSLVFGHGYEYQDAAKRVAPEFPHTIFITTSGTTVGPNLAGMSFGFADACYLAGMLAASMTKTGKIGMLGGTELPPVVEGFQAFEKGAHEVNPKATIVTSYIGNWDDVSAGKEQALAMFAQGIDVVFQNADAAGLGVFQAARERHAFVIGSNSNQNDVAPDVILASVAIDLPLAFLSVARDIKAGTFKPAVIKLGEQSHVVTLAFNAALAGKIPPAARARIDSLQTKMLAGELHVTLDPPPAKH